MSEAAARFTLRDLPLPAKVVVTGFLLAVGVGYTAAMVQLHFQDAKSGQPMPTVHDVVLKFTGKKYFETDPPPPVSKFVKLLVTPAGAPFNGTGTMLPAFTTRDDGEFMRANRGAPTDRARLQAERDGEANALVLWAKAEPAARKKAYEDDHFGLDKDQMPAALTKKFLSGDGTAVKVKSIIEARCVRCHRTTDPDDTKAAAYPLENYAQLEKHLAVPAAVTVPSGGGWVRVEEPMSLDKLTQSTHAHLLSFAVLFSLTGLVFAFTSYPVPVRCILGPWVLIAIVTDVSFWWLARLCTEWGPYFAMGVIGTGGAAGLGLAAQVVLSLFNMYGPKGKFVLVIVFALGGAAAGLVYVNQIKPGLAAKKQKLEATNAEGGKTGSPAGNGGGKAPPKNDGKTDIPPPPGVSQFERLLTIPKGAKVSDLKWKGNVDGGMARASFDKDGGDWAAAAKAKDEAAQQKLTPERQGELAALVAWSKLPDAARRAAWDADAFPPPPDLAGKPVSAEFLTPDKKVMVKLLVTDRCIRCHADEPEERLFADYDGLRKYLDAPAAGQADAGNAKAAPVPAPSIPAAKE